MFYIDVKLGISPQGKNIVNSIWKLSNEGTNRYQGS
jgi:hypothetical protein